MFELKTEPLSKGLVRRAIELGCKMPPWTGSFQARRASSSPARHDTGHDMSQAHLEQANRQVAQSEQIVAGWRELITRMQADGRDVTVARDLLDTFQHDLEARSSNRDMIRRMIAEQRP